MYMMRRYTVSKARERFAAVLDEADRTGSVMIVAHARLRGWRLATGDAALLERLSAGESVSI